MYYCNKCQNWRTPERTCPRCNVTCRAYAETDTLEGQLALPVGVCADCAKLDLTGNECWEKHFGKGTTSD